MAMNSRKRAKRKTELETAQRRLDTHSSGGEFTAISIPKGMGFWNPKKEGVFMVDIIPFKVGEGNPYAGKGKLYYERTYYTHRSVGPDRKSYVCMAKTFGKKCAVCDYRNKLSSDPDMDKDTENLVKDLGPKQRQIFNVFVHEEKDKGVQLWEISFHNFGDYLDSKIRKADPDKKAKYQTFFDPDGGYTLRLGASEEQMGSNKFLEFSDIEFKRRKDGISEELLEAAACLDEVPKKIKYEDLKAILEGKDEDEDEDEDDKEDEDEEDDEEEEEDDDDEDDDDDDEDDDDEEDDNDEDDEDDDEDDSEDDDDEDDEEDDEGDDEDDDEDDDGDDDVLAVGDKAISAKYKGKKRIGKITKIFKSKGKRLAYLECKDRTQPYTFEMDELSAYEPEDNDPPFKKKKKKVK